MQVADAQPLVLTPQMFRRCALAGVLALYLIVSSGATVRLTASGLGCEHWPGCTASNPFPAKDYHSFIEFGNRIVSAVTIVLTLVLWVGALITPYLPRWTRWLAGVTFFGTLAQAPLGAITVYAGLNPLLVMMHFLLALLVLAAGVIVAIEACRLELGTARVQLPRAARAGALVLVASCLALVVSGTLATAAGPHPGSRDVHRLWHLHAAVYVHVRATAVFGVTFLVLAIYLWRRRKRWPLLVEGAAIILGILVVQMGVGELQYRTHLPWWLVLVHVSIAAALWAAVVAYATLLRRPLALLAP
jgi:heme a synthase